MVSNPKNAPEIRQAKSKELLLTQLRKMPIIQIACQKTDTSRATYYRWRSEDEEFKKNADEAIAEGEEFITDMSESQLITLIRDRNFPAIQLWLRHHHQKYNNKIEITTNIKQVNEPLTPDQEKTVREALRLVAFSDSDGGISQNHGHKQQE